MQTEPTAVPAGAKQAGEAAPQQARRARWAWAEASIWTERMLAALENGVNRYFADLGLFSLEQAHIAACQSMQMAH
jgi:hypothetical protein